MRFDAPINIFLASLASGYATVFASAYIAPSKSKKVPAITAGTIMCVMGAGAIVFRLSSGEWFRSFEGLCVVAGAAIAMVQASKNELV